MKTVQLSVTTLLDGINTVYILKHLQGGKKEILQLSLWRYPFLFIGQSQNPQRFVFEWSLEEEVEVFCLVTEVAVARKKENMKQNLFNDKSNLHQQVGQQI